MYSIKNKRILLVGASGVLGSKYADFLHKNGAKLIMSDINNTRFTKVINIFVIGDGTIFRKLSRTETYNWNYEHF